MVFADDLADEVFNRVIRRLAEGEAIENLPGYCFSVARFILLEQARAPENKRVAWKEMPPLTAALVEAEEDERLECLEKCLQSLPREQRDLLLEYYQDDRRAKIAGRLGIAERLGLTRNALANRIVRLRHQLEACVTRCVKKNAAPATRIRLQ